MKVIPIRQFLSANQKVQDEVMKWWKPQMMDLYMPLDGDITVIYRQSQLEAVRKLKNEWDVPLLTVGQLIDFIEWRTGYGINQIEFGAGDCYWVFPYFEPGYDMEQEKPRWYGEEMSFCNEELIQALWECACEVAMDSYYDV